MKVDSDDVWFDDSLYYVLWSRGKFKISSKIRVRAVKFEDGVVEATIPELGIKKSRRELLKEEKEKKTPILRRDEEEIGEGKGIDGSDDYDISPTADGDVKIKKKKAPKKEDKDTEKKTAKKKPKKAKKTTTKKKTPAKKPVAKKKAPAKKTEKKK